MFKKLRLLLTFFQKFGKHNFELIKKEGKSNGFFFKDVMEIY